MPLLWVRSVSYTHLDVYKRQMLDGVSVYRDRDKYLARSLAVTARMEELIREILTVSRLESDGEPVKMERLDLSELVQEQLEQDEALFEQRGLRFRVSLSDGVTVLGERALLGLSLIHIFCRQRPFV